MANLLTKLLRAISGGNKPAAREPLRRRRIAARYDAAVTNSDNMRHWANADYFSANSANDPETRRILRSRARYEVVEGNSYAKGIISTLANDCIGTGPRLQMLTPNPQANRKIETAFRKWAEAVHLAEKLRTMRKAKAQDGESFALFFNNPALPTLVQLDLRVIEADQIATPTMDMLNPNAIDGIEFDEAGNPAYYHLLPEHPGDSSGMTFNEYERIPAKNMLHWFTADRPGQARGIPDITTALPLFAQLRRYTMAVIAAAETAADFAVTLESDAAPDGADPVEPMDSFEIEQRMMTTMPAGWKANQMKAEQPVTTYGMFKGEILNEIARCLNMPFNVAAGNSSTYNYASGRLDHQTYFKSIRVEQDHAESVAVDRILMAFFDEASMIPGLLPSLAEPYGDWEYDWIWPGTEHVDPMKEASAQEVRLRNYTTTLAEESARDGADWQDRIVQRAKEIALMESLGLPQPGVIVQQGTPSSPQQSAQDQQDMQDFQDSQDFQGRNHEQKMEKAGAFAKYPSVREFA